MRLTFDEISDELNGLYNKGASASTRGNPTAALRALAARGLVAMARYEETPEFGSAVSGNTGTARPGRWPVMRLSQARAVQRWRGAWRKLHRSLLLAVPNVGGLRAGLEWHWFGHRNAAGQLLDGAMLSLLHEEGWLTAQPDNVVGDVRSSIALPVQPGLAGASMVVMASPDMNLRDCVELTKKDMGDRPVCEVVYHWLILGHEAAHTVFAGINAPFQPTQSSAPPMARQRALAHGFSGNMAATEAVATGGWDPEIVDTFSRFVVGPFGQPEYSRWFSECFADTYGSMLIMRQCQMSAEAIGQVTLMRDGRAAASAALVDEDDSNEYLDAYDTSGCLSCVLETISEWKSLPPEELRQRALEITSDIMIATMDGRPWAWKRLIAKLAKPSDTDLVRGCVGAVLEGRVEEWRAALAADHAGHPLVDMWLDIVDKRQPDIRMLGKLAVLKSDGVTLSSCRVQDNPGVVADLNAACGELDAYYADRPVINLIAGNAKVKRLVDWLRNGRPTFVASVQHEPKQAAVV